MRRQVETKWRRYKIMNYSDYRCNRCNANYNCCNCCCGYYYCCTGPTGPTGTLKAGESLFNVIGTTGTAALGFGEELIFESNTLDITVTQGSAIVTIENPNITGPTGPQGDIGPTGAHGDIGRSHWSSGRYRFHRTAGRHRPHWTSGRHRSHRTAG